VNTSKVMFLVVLIIISLCLVNTQPVKSQDVGIIYIGSDGSVYTSTNLTVPIQQVGNVYTFTDNIENYYLVVQRNSIVVDGAGYSLAGQGEVGIDLSYRNNVTIKNVRIGFALYGIYLWNASMNTISGNTLTYTGYGVYLVGASQNNIIGNNVTNSDIGINLMSSSNNILRDNKMNNDHNLAVYGSEPSHFDNDIDDSNIVNGKKVYYLISESNLFINPTTFPDLGFLALVNCQNITVHDLELTNNGHGILLAYTTDTTITQNHMTDNYNGIGLFLSSRNYIIGNYIANNYRGIQLGNASNGNSFSTNDVNNNTHGVFLFDSLQNTFVTNNITNNEIGIGFKASSYNMIRGNYFISNERQVYDVSMDDPTLTASTNIWGVGYPAGGNYWSDYTGVDVKSGENKNQTGSDGLGDTPYIIDQNNQDNFPLMPYGSPPAIFIGSPENKTYTVNSVSLSFTVSEPTSWIKYSLDGQANITITEDITLSGLADGMHSITVYVQDTDGQTGTSETIYFTIAEGSEPPTETPQSEGFPITWIAAIIVVVVIVGVALLYFLKIKKK
jgi:parallel beta-helix repeat protein